MRGIMFLALIAVVLVAAGVVTVKWNNGAATINFNKDKARERAAQVLEEGKRLEAQLESNAPH